MSRYIKKIFLLFTCLLLSACSTTPSSQNQLDKEGSLKVAKINAQLGMAYLDEGNIQRAKLKLLLALKQAPNAPEPWYSMAYYLDATGDKAQAGQYYQKAIEVAPNRGDAHNNYGTYLCKHGEYQAAVQQFLLATKDTEYLNLADAYENAGLCSLKAKQKNEATDFFSQALMHDPERPTSLINLAEIEYSNGKYQAAKDKLKQFNNLSKPTEQSIRLSESIKDKIPSSDTVTVMDEPYADNEDISANNMRG